VWEWHCPCARGLSNNALKLTALSAPPALDWRRRFVLAVARTAPQLSAVLGKAKGTDGVKRMISRKHEARVAGLLYLLMSVAAVVAFNNVPTWSMVGGDAVATANKIAASPTSYRIGVLSDLVAQILFVFLVLALFELFKGVNKRLAALMAALVFVQVPMAFANMLLGIAPLILLSGDEYLSVFDKGQLDAMALAFLNVRGYGIKANMAFWGLWLLPFGLLVFRSGFIPRVLGVFLIIGCFGYLAVSTTSLLFPAYARTVTPLTGLAFGEILIILWLVIKGVRTESLERQPST